MRLSVDRKNTLVKAHSTLNRRTLFAGGAALGTAGMLAACSGKNGGSGSTQAAATAGANIADLVKINKQDVSAPQIRRKAASGGHQFGTKISILAYSGCRLAIMFVLFFV